MSITLTLVILVAFAATSSGANFDRQGALDKMPKNMILAAPYSAFYSNLTINTEIIPAYASLAKSEGVTTVWICGSMSQFDSLTVEERMIINAKWVEAAHENGLYVIVHVGTTVQQDAIKLATHAAAIGADAIASVPPYYNRPSSLEGLFEFLTPIAKAGNGLPLFYYHIPGVTGYDIEILDLFDEAMTKLPELIGVKFVNDDILDWFNIVSKYNETHALMFAPEPKMQSFAVGMGRGSIMAEDFYAASYERMRVAFLRGQMDVSRAEQHWKYEVSGVFSKYGGQNAERAIYKSTGKFDLGPPRPPSIPFNESMYESLVADLKATNFYERLNPNWTPSQ